jgi:putative ABC transport system permease protein
VIGETALGLMLLIGAGLLIRSFDRLMSVDPGFNYHNLVTFRVGMPAKRFQDEKLLQMTQQMQARFSTLPGVKASTYAFPMPLAAGDMHITFTIDGKPSAPGDEPAARAGVAPTGFFEAMQIPLMKGRFFGETENRSKTPPVVIVNEAFARRFFAGDALGKRMTSGLSSGDQPESREIVGVVGDVNRNGLNEEPQPEYYIPFAQVPLAPPIFALRVGENPEAYVAQVRAAVAQMDPSLPVYGVRTNLLTRSTAQQKFQTMLISGFAVIALVLAAIGLYAVLSYMVTHRTMELGLRMALGARRGDVMALILNRGLMLCGAGIVIGLVASAGLSRFLTTLLFHTTGLDALTFATTTCLLVAISTASCLIPAWRASRLDPNETLRQQ